MKSLSISVGWGIRCHYFTVHLVKWVVHLRSEGNGCTCLGYNRFPGGPPFSSSWSGLCVVAAWTTRNRFPEAPGIGGSRSVSLTEEGVRWHTVFNLVHAHRASGSTHSRVNTTSKPSTPPTCAAPTFLVRVSVLRPLALQTTSFSRWHPRG